jgi:hypothetical protein
VDVSIWDELTPEEQCVMTNALEVAYLKGVIADFQGQQSRAELCGCDVHGQG